ncbi:MAG: right-handed parallel beta-helix repeat-containing protein [Acidobacteriota bacterium]
MSRRRVFCRLAAALAMLASGVLSGEGVIQAQKVTGVLLPDGKEFASWERPFRFSRTYYVDNRNPRAADANPGTEQLPFATIGKAAQVLQPGERVVIQTGVYREQVIPARGGTGPDGMISYEAAPGASVVIKGSRVVKSGWEPSTGYVLSKSQGSSPKIYRRRLDDLDFRGYNPFGMANMMQDRVYLNPTPAELKRHLFRRGMVFVDGKRLEQVELYRDLAAQDGAFWCEHEGLTIHVRLPGDADPSGHELELAIQEQILAPQKRGLNYIRVQGLTFEHAANGFPVPQRGMVSASQGHHWIIEDCVLRQANGVGLDIGYQDWHREVPEVIGHSIVRRNHLSDIGVCGLAGMGVQNTLIEANLIERVGWQDMELTWETGGIKLHMAKNCLLRNNIIRHLIHSVGIWLDYQNVNSRVTGNVIGHTLETLRGGIYLEASHERNVLDHNIIWRATEGKGGSTSNFPPHGGWGITVDGSDETVIAHNLIGETQDAAIKFRTVEGRIVGTRGGTSRGNQVVNNIFYRCGKAIDFANRDNTAEGNLYTRDRGGVTDESQGVGRGLNWLSGPGPALMLDLEAWKKYFGFDQLAAYADMTLEVNLDTLSLTGSFRGEIPKVQTLPLFNQDLNGKPAGEQRSPGPFLHLPASPTQVSIDPRRGKP